MAINNMFIYCKTLANFKKELEAGNILDTSIVFIQDVQQIYTHGQYFDAQKVGQIDFNSDGTGEIFNDYENNKATGKYSMATGEKVAVTGDWSSGFGYYNLCPGVESMVMGEYNICKGGSSFAGGGISRVDSNNSIAYGMFNNITSNAYNSISVGQCNFINKPNSAAFGSNSIIEGTASLSYGAGSNKYYQVDYANSTVNKETKTFNIILKGKTAQETFIKEGVYFVLLNELFKIESVQYNAGTYTYTIVTDIAPTFSELDQEFGDLGQFYEDDPMLWIYFMAIPNLCKANACLIGGFSNTINSGANASVAIGGYNVVKGSYGFATNFYNNTTNSYESAFGKWNKSTSGKTLFSVGNGTAEASRKNAFEIQSDGNVLIQQPGTGTMVNLYNTLQGKQNTLVSGETIKTINGQSLLGSGDITIEGGGSDIVIITADDFSEWRPNDSIDGDLISSFTDEASEKIYNGLKNNKIFGFSHIPDSDQTSISLLSSIMILDIGGDLENSLWTISGEIIVSSENGIPSTSYLSISNRGSGGIIVFMSQSNNRNNGSGKNLLSDSYSDLIPIQDNLTSTEGVLSANQGKVLNETKQDKLVSGTNIKTINGQTLLGSGDIEIQGGSSDVNKAYVDEQLELKVDKTVYEADKATFALKTEIPSIEGLVTSEELQTGLDEKQDTLVSGTNIKTINGETLLGEGNIEIQGGGSGISDAPADGKKYVRSNNNWVEETKVDTSSFATKTELGNYALKSEIPDTSTLLSKTEASSTYVSKNSFNSLFNVQYASKVGTRTYVSSINSSVDTSPSVSSITFEVNSIRFSDNATSKTTINLPSATPSQAGLMSGTDKEKFDSLKTLSGTTILGSPDGIQSEPEINATSVTIPIPYMMDDQEGQWAEGGTAKYTIPQATSSEAGVMSAADKAKLDSLGSSITLFSQSESGVGYNEIPTDLKLSGASVYKVYFLIPDTTRSPFTITLSNPCDLEAIFGFECTAKSGSTFSQTSDITITSDGDVKITLTAGSTLIKDSSTVIGSFMYATDDR